MVTRKYARNVWAKIICSIRSNEIYRFMAAGYHTVRELAEKQNNRARALENNYREFKIRVSAVRFCPKPPFLLTLSALKDALFAFGVSLVCQRYFTTLKMQNLLPKTTIKNCLKSHTFLGF